MIIAAGAVTVAALVTGMAVSSGGDEPSDETAEEDGGDAPTLAEVVRGDLTRKEQFDGTVDHGPATPLSLAATGTLTWLPDVGEVLDPGDVVAEVDGRPVVALAGSIPMRRDLGPDVSDGKDVLQLECILASMGYAEEFDVTVDDDWTSATTQAVKAFQEDHGQVVDGEIALGEVVFIDGSRRIDAVGGAVGQQAAEAGITVTSTAQVVRLDVPADKADLLAVGDAVDVDLPDGTSMRGKVKSIGVPTTSQEGETTYPVTVTLTAKQQITDGTPADVTVTAVSAKNVLTVPVEALLALAEGGYAVEVAGDGETSRLVKVKVGDFADGMVAVEGDLRAGDEVIVP